MVAARTAARGLSPADLDGIRETLAAGRRPKVMFTETAGQIAGQVGQVVQLADPAGGEEFVVVRFGRDELPFSPADLVLPARGAARKTVSATATRKAAATSKAPEPPPGPELRLTPPPVPAPREQRAPAPPAAETPAATGEPAPAPRKAGRAAKPKPPAALTVTLAYTEGEWTVAATQGSKSLAKPYVIKPAEALKMVALLDVPGVQEAVEHIVAAERAVAQDHAQRLRSQLAEVEAKLAELGELS
ncbi:MAG: hypothetical protein AUI14_24290 [Actinobacteria bacterium 13_2_20CM_2_71_6]|nr:MAG: hypothetical protein AUI14_24290 [Actinobacteria bacterium 13_2_20CM_2_71_6]